MPDTDDRTGPVPLLDLKAQYAQIASEVIPALREVCESCRFALGPRVEAFETAFARYCEAEHAVAVNCGTNALLLAMRCLEVGPGDEVITAPMTFVATAWSVTYVGATPVFVDIDPVTRTMDPRLIEAAITPRTRAILPVHLYGMPADMDAIRRIADQYRLPVVEDAAQAHGARYRGRRVGGIGEIGCFSFYPGKNLGAYGEGGMLVTNDPEIAAQARCLRDHGQRQRYLHETVGYNCRMDAFQGAVLGIKLKYLDDWNAARRRVAGLYRERLSDSAEISLPAELPDGEPVYHMYVIELDHREEVMKHLLEAGIGTGLHYPIPVHLQPAYAHLRYAPGAFPITERLARRCLSLPMYPELSEPRIDRVCERLLSVAVLA